ncbi:MAG: isocitrate lyase/PEP mutase family protein, partial [Pseudolabrys sp.]
YEAAGAAAIQIEDQEFPKKCGHTLGRRVIPAEDMVRKIKVAREARESADFLIIARTDARTAHGLDEALRRAEAFLKAGADILFIESPDSIEEMHKIGQTFDVPLLAQMVESGRTPVLTRQQLEEIGYRIAIFPVSGLLAMGAALRSVYGEIQAHGSTVKWPGEMDTLDRMARLMGFERVWTFDKENAEI